MGIEQEVEQLIKKYEQEHPTIIGRSIFASKELKNFDRVLASLESNILQPMLEARRYSSLSRAVLEYKSGNKEKAVSEINDLRQRAEQYLIKKGYDPKIEPEWFGLYQEYLRLSSHMPLNPGLAGRLKEVQALMSQYEE